MNSAIAQSLPILSLVVVGFLLKQAGLIRPGDGQVMTRLIVNTTLPAIIFLSVAHANVTQADWQFWRCAVYWFPWDCGWPRAGG